MSHFKSFQILLMLSEAHLWLHGSILVNSSHWFFSICRQAMPEPQISLHLIFLLQILTFSWKISLHNSYRWFFEFFIKKLVRLISSTSYKELSFNSYKLFFIDFLIFGLNFYKKILSGSVKSIMSICSSSEYSCLKDVLLFIFFH